MLLRERSSASDVDDHLGQPWKRWGLGVALAGLLVAYGIHCLAAGRAYLPGRAGGMHVTGALAIAMGIAYAALGAFLHFRFFWHEHRTLWRLAEPGMLVAILAFVGAIGYVLVRTLVLS